MKKVFRLLIIVLLLFSIVALSSCASIELKPRENEDDIASSENEHIVLKEDDNNTEPTSIPNINEGETNINPPVLQKEEVQDVVVVEKEDTIGQGVILSDLEEFSMNKRLMGLIDDSNPHGIEDHINGIVVTGQAFILNERFKDEIYTGIRLGDKFEDIRSILGEPGWETDSILLYRNWNYYILFQGNAEAQYVVIMKAPDTGYDQDFLSTIISELNADDYTSLDKSLVRIDPKGSFFSDNGFITGGGYYASSDQGIIILEFDERYIEVYNNYQGNLFDHMVSNPRYEVRFIDRDLTIDNMLADFNSFLGVEELIKNEAVLSPDGKLSAAYEWIYSEEQYFIIRTMDNSMQDRYIYAATFSKFHWLTNNHLVYIDAYNDLPYAIDVNFSDPSAINILYQADIIEERDVDYGKYKFEVLEIKDGVISLIDTINNMVYSIQIIEGRNGEITFKSE